MNPLLKLIGILFGVLVLRPILRQDLAILALSYEEVPFASVNLTTNGENDHSIGSHFLLNCSFALAGKAYKLREVIFYLNSMPIGTFHVSHSTTLDNYWESSTELSQNWALNVYAQSNTNVRPQTSFSVWIQPLSTKASGNYSCLVWLRLDGRNEGKFVSNMFPIEI